MEPSILPEKPLMESYVLVSLGTHLKVGKYDLHTWLHNFPSHFTPPKQFTNLTEEKNSFKMKEDLEWKLSSR